MIVLRRRTAESKLELLMRDYEAWKLEHPEETMTAQALPEPGDEGSEA
jgi:hypothetical protein